MNPNKVDTVVREALQVYEQKEPRYLDVILKAYRAHIEREGATNTRFNIDFQSSPSIIYEPPDRQGIKRWFRKQGYLLEFYKCPTSDLDGASDEVSISKLV
jgi:hypothetical protein